MRIYYVVYPADPVLLLCLDAIRLLCNPQEKHHAHITVRGPYRQHYKLTRVSQIIEGAPIRLTEAGTFWGKNQNTVFLTCESPRLAEVWKKTEYGYHPHITIYDGDSRPFACSVLEVLQGFDFNLTFTASRLWAIKSTNGQSSMKLHLDIDWHSISKILGQAVDASSLDSLWEAKRIELLLRLCSLVGARRTSSGVAENHEGLIVPHYEYAVPV